MIRTSQFLFFLFQFCCYFAGIGFSAGGGNFPGQEENGFVICKVVFLLIPLASLSYLILIRPNSTIQKMGIILKSNKYLLIYFLISLILIPFAMNTEYSLKKLSYTIFEFLGLLALLTQYFIRFQDSSFIPLKKLLNYFSFFVLLFPLYIFILNGFSFSNFRFKLESFYLIHPNILASFYTPLLMWHGLHAVFSNKTRLTHTIFSIVFLAVLYLLFSRTTLIALIITCGLLPFIAFLYTKSTNSLILCILIILLSVISLILMITGILPFETIAGLFARGDSIDSLLTLTNRTVLWDQISNNLSFKNFMIGYGYSVIDEDFGIDLGTGILYGAHNAYFSVLLGSGVFALIAILAYLGKNLVTIAINQKSFRPEIFYSLISSYILFFIISFFSEEIGINFSITFAFLIFMTNITLYNKRQEIV